MNYRRLALSSLLLVQLAGCLSWDDQSDFINHNAPGIIISPSAPSKGTYVGYLLSPDKKFKYPLTLELLEYRVKDKKSPQFKLISQIALGWNSPVYETFISENIKFSPKKRIFRSTKKNRKIIGLCKCNFFAEQQPERQIHR